MKRYLWLVVVWAVIGFPVRAQEVGAPNPAGVTIHVVQRGEILYAIALRFGVTTETLVRLNGIANPNSLQVGERLLVPASDSLIGMPEPQIHTVRPGETLRSIAALYGRSPDDLAAQNGLADPNSVRGHGGSAHSCYRIEPSAISAVWASWRHRRKCFCFADHSCCAAGRDAVSHRYSLRSNR